MRMSVIDLSIIHNPYFTILQLTDNLCELKSNNTGHSWLITQSRDGYYHMHHKHQDEDPWHDHFASASIQDCLLEVVSHDEFQLRHRKRPRFPPHDTFFDTILQAYQ